MIVVKVKESSKGHRLSVGFHNGHKFNHFYNDKESAKRAWDSFVKQIKEDNIKIEL